jgi:ubiquitin carboxyl-terminal hydrolase 36/42
LISKHLRVGRQEDAHEFLLYLLDALEKSAKQFKQTQSNSFASQSNEDNLIQKLFGGKLVSSVTCLKCKNVYKKYDNFLDVSLHIYNSESLEKCFENFCKTESLSGNNKYFCEKCKTKNDAIKKFSFDKCK